MKKSKYELEISGKKVNDCDVILNDVENIFGSIGRCLDTALDEKKSKMQVVGSLFGIGKSIAKFGWDATSCAVKHTPKAIATVANAKRELTETITDEYVKFQREMKEKELEDKIAHLKRKL